MPKSINRTSRRALLAGLAAATVPIVAGAEMTAPVSDPIFDAIATHKAAERAHSDAVLTQSRMEEKLPREKRRSHISAWEEEIVETDDPRWIAAVRATSEASDNLDDCAMALLDIRPTTLAGLGALFRHVSKEADAGCLPDGVEVDDREYEHFEGALLSVATGWISGMPESCWPAAARVTATARVDADPIFAVLAEHRAATKAYLEASAVDGDLKDGTEEWKRARVVTLAAIKREHAALRAVLTTEPTTLVGAVAVLGHVGQDNFLGEATDGGYGETLLLVEHDDRGGPLYKAAHEFPGRLAKNMRGLMAVERS
jgi:hypothetical protein